VKGIFSEGFGKVKEVKPELGDLWYVTFESDDDAVSAYELLKNKTFQDKPIKARLKIESTFRSM
jgi:hypothetical protein